MKKRILLVIAIAIIILMMRPTFVFAASGGQDVGGCTVYIHDNADLLSDSEESDLIEDITNKCKNINYNILFLTTDDTGGKSTMVYSDDYMDDMLSKGRQRITGLEEVEE
jgi:uncharacterized membrane protein YgcG